MTIHFAAARSATAAFIKHVRRADMIGRAANDNSAAPHDMLLRDALIHFARHGLRAAEVARQNAERAFFAGDRAAYRHWLDICRALDRRMAMVCHTRIEQGCN